MPRVRVNGVTLYYEVQGAGDPLVLVAGLGADTRFWFKQVPALAARYRVVTFDNRGMGRSDVPQTAWTLRDMADDVRGLLDALGIGRAHVLGASMGGFIAQELALAFPERARSLVLCCTSGGGADAVPIPQETLSVLLNRSGDPARDLRALLAVSFGTDYPETHAAEVEAYVAWRVAHPQSPEGYQRQLSAALAHDASARLGSLSMPVLILHGDQDRIVPVDNARLLAARIPGARLHIFPGAGHLFLWERAEEVNALLLEFLASVPP